MSTRCTIWFHDSAEDKAGWSRKPTAIVYRHGDGYPDGEHGVLADLVRFYQAVWAQAKDTRFGDAAYLAAKYVVWQARENARSYDPSTGKRTAAQLLDFLGVGVVAEDPSDIDYRYHVWCGSANGREPLVTVDGVRALGEQGIRIPRMILTGWQADEGEEEVEEEAHDA